MESKGLCKCGCGQKTSIATQTVKQRGYVAGEPRPYVNAGHAVRHKSGRDYDIDPETGCWLWRKETRYGYGRKWDGEKKKLCSAHVWYWEQQHGPKPEGFDLDHMCHNRDESCPGGHTCRHRACVNPDHLELATRSTNIRRGRVRRITQQQVDEIRAAPSYSGYRGDLAEKYGVAKVTITKLRGKSPYR